MSDLLWLTDKQMRRIEPYLPLSHGIPRVDDKRVLMGIIFLIRNGLDWRDAPRDYGPHKTIYKRFIRWSRLGVFNRIFAEPSAKGPRLERLMIDATHIKAHRTPFSADSATRSRSSSDASRTGGASTHATTVAPAPSCPPSRSPQPSSSGDDQ